MTRPKAQVLRDLGAKVVEGDLNDKASVEAALKGAYGAFLVTNFWDHFSKEKEVCQVGTKFKPFLFSCLAMLPSLEGVGPHPITSLWHL